jgi:hypothetical protein
MIKCQSCGTNNLEGSQFCDECGTPLKPASNLETQINQPVFTETPAVQSASVTSVGIPLIIEEPKFTENALAEKTADQLGKQTASAKLTIERGIAVGTEFQISLQESYIGRWDADNGIFPDVDLDAFDPEAKVSRRHARIRFSNGQYFIEDLGSTNGTFVNRGRRLIPGNPQILSDGDEIIVGKTFLRFNLI